MAIYTPPALNAVDFTLSVQSAHSVAPYLNTLSVYSVPTLSAVDFVLSPYTSPTYNTINFEFLGGVTPPVTVSNQHLMMMGVG